MTSRMRKTEDLYKISNKRNERMTMNKIKRFEKLCTELSNLVTELGREGIEMLYHTERDRFSLVKDGDTLTKVDAPLMTMED